MSILCPRRASPRLSASTEVATPPTLGSSVCTNWRIFNALDNETFRPLKIFVVARERLYRTRRDAAIKLIRFSETFVEQRFRAENTKIGQRTSAKQYAIRPDETIIPHPHRLRGLPILFEIDAVADDLGMKSGEG